MVARRGSPLQLAALDHLYRFQRFEQVAPFLERQPDLVELLVRAVEPLERLFGPEAQRTLDVLVDPEDDTPTPHLYVFIRSPLSNDDALDALATFDRTWWLDHAVATGDRLTFDLRLA